VGERRKEVGAGEGGKKGGGEKCKEAKVK